MDLTNYTVVTCILLPINQIYSVRKTFHVSRDLNLILSHCAQRYILSGFIILFKLRENQFWREFSEIFGQKKTVKSVKDEFIKKVTTKTTYFPYIRGLNYAHIYA